MPLSPSPSHTNADGACPSHPPSTSSTPLTQLSQPPPSSPLAPASPNNVELPVEEPQENLVRAGDELSVIVDGELARIDQEISRIQQELDQQRQRRRIITGCKKAAHVLLENKKLNTDIRNKIRWFSEYVAQHQTCLKEICKLDKTGAQLLSIVFTRDKLPDLGSFQARDLRMFSNILDSHQEIDRVLALNSGKVKFPFSGVYCALPQSHGEAHSLKRKENSGDDTRFRKKLRTAPPIAPSIAGDPAVCHHHVGPYTPAAHPTDADPEHPVSPPAPPCLLADTSENQPSQPVNSAIQPSAATGGGQASGISGSVGIPRSESREPGPPSPIHSSYNTPSQLSGQLTSWNNPTLDTNLSDQRRGHVLQHPLLSQHSAWSDAQQSQPTKQIPVSGFLNLTEKDPSVEPYHLPFVTPPNPPSQGSGYQLPSLYQSFVSQSTTPLTIPSSSTVNRLLTVLPISSSHTAHPPYTTIPAWQDPVPSYPVPPITSPIFIPSIEFAPSFPGLASESQVVLGPILHGYMEASNKRKSERGSERTAAIRLFTPMVLGDFVFEIHVCSRALDEQINNSPPQTWMSDLLYSSMESSESRKERGTGLQVFPNSNNNSDARILVMLGFEISLDALFSLFQ